MKSPISENTSIHHRLFIICLLCMALLKSVTVVVDASPGSSIEDENELVKNLTDEAEEEQVCFGKRMQIEVIHPDCEVSAKTHINYCTGSCLSYTILGEVEPFVRKEFRCCASRKLTMKKRKLTFRNCRDENGRIEPGPKNITLFFPFINRDHCECVKPASVLSSK